MTVAALARSRPVARQWIHRLANDLEKQRLIEFIDNPEHKRAKSITLLMLRKLRERLNSDYRKMKS